jgi:O-acetylserine/cysteine efflux transporter
MNFDRRAVAALVAAGVLWGMTVPATKLAGAWLPPAWLAEIRFALAAAILLVACRSKLRAACSPAILVWGAVGYGGTILIQNEGVMRTSVTHAALLVGATPVLVAIVAAVRLRSVARPAAWAGYAVSLAGVALVARAGHGGGATLSGDGLIGLSLLFSASFTVAQTRLLKGRDPIAVTALQFLAAAVVMLPVAVGTEGVVPPAAGMAHGLPVVIALALAGTLAPFTLFAYGQARVSAAAAATFLNLEPLVGAAIGVVAFGDPFGGVQLVGSVAILAGIAVGSLPPAALRRAAAGLAGALGPAGSPGRAELVLCSDALGSIGPPGPAELPGAAELVTCSHAVSSDQLVHDGVDAGVDTLAGGIRVVPGHDLASPLLERDDRSVSGHDGAQLGVIEDHRVRLVAEQPGAPLGVGGGNGVGRHVHDVEVRPGGRGEGLGDLVPGEHVVGGDVERLAEGARMAQQRHEAAGEVRMMGQGPQRCAVAVHHDRPALAHPGQRGPAAVERDEGLVVGVRGPHDGGREPLGAVEPGEEVLAGDLVAGVPPERVAQRRGLQYWQPRRRRLVSRRGADEHVLADPPAQQVDVGLDLLWREGDPVDDGVELEVA